MDGAAEQKDEAVESQQTPETEAETDESGGAAMLRQAVDRVLKEKCKKIAEALVRRSEQGHLQSIKFMYDLADEETKLGTAEIVKRLRSLANEWGVELEWRDGAGADCSEPTAS